MDNNNPMNLSFCRSWLKELKRRESILLSVQNYSNEAEYSVNSSFPNSAAGHSEGPNLTWFKIAIPIICFLGIVGNVLNLLVLTRRRLLSGMDRLEKSANYGLLALAVSDMLFCIIVFPHSFIDDGYENDQVFVLYYKLYGVATINLMMMTSTWLVVNMAVQRYIVVVYPLHARFMLSTARTLIGIVLVFVLSAVLTLPSYLHMGVTKCYTPHPEPRVTYGFTQFQESKNMFFYMRWIWPIISDFIPLLILGVCNARLIRELRKASSQRKQTCRGQSVKDTHHKITLTLVVIVLMFFFLVSPSEILKYINPYHAWGDAGHIVAAVTNVLQTLNFAFNFVLYCLVNASFRLTMQKMFTDCFCKKKKRSTPDYSDYSKSLVQTNGWQATKMTEDESVCAI